MAVVCAVLNTAMACSALPPSASVAASGSDAGLPQWLVAEVTADGAFTHLEELQRIADANGGNRALGTAGYEASVEYVAGVLRNAGFAVETASFTTRSFAVRRARLAVDGAPLEWTPLGFSPSAPASGITAPLAVIAQDATSGCERADYAGAPAGAVVLVAPGGCSFRQKSTTAAAAGAAAVLVSGVLGGPLNHASLGTDVSGAVPTGGLSQADGEALVARSGASMSMQLTTTVEDARSSNIIAQTRTGDPDEVVVAGAHLDSVPQGPGINDNGSGTAALLETATRLGGSPAVKNAVRLAFWGAEEEGLAGVRQYVLALSEIDRKRIALYLNVEMLGSTNAGYFVYDGDDSDDVDAGTGPEGSATVERVLVDQLAAAGVPAAGTDFDGEPAGYSPFIAADIPAGGLFTAAEGVKTSDEARLWGGTAGAPYDRCYHQACDRVENVDRTALDRNTDAVAGTIAWFALSTAGLSP